MEHTVPELENKLSSEVQKGQIPSSLDCVGSKACPAKFALPFAVPWNLVAMQEARTWWVQDDFFHAFGIQDYIAKLSGELTT